MNDFNRRNGTRVTTTLSLAEVPYAEKPVAIACASRNYDGNNTCAFAFMIGVIFLDWGVLRDKTNDDIKRRRR